MIITLDRIFANCVEYGDCLLWQGKFSNRSPQLTVGRTTVQLRRLVFEQTGGEAIPAGRFPVMRCREPRCLQHKHIQLMTHKQIGALAAKEGKLSTPSRCAAVAAACQRPGHAKLTTAQAREIRLSTESGPVLAERYGIHRSLVPRIKRGEAWRETTRGASVFNL